MSIGEKLTVDSSFLKTVNKNGFMEYDESCWSIRDNTMLIEFWFDEQKNIELMFIYKINGLTDEKITLTTVNEYEYKKWTNPLTKKQRKFIRTHFNECSF